MTGIKSLVLKIFGWWLFLDALFVFLWSISIPADEEDFGD